MAKHEGKVWGIGLSRTGTTSLNAALWHLGYRAIHNPDAGRMLTGDWSVLDGYDAGTDISVAGLFKALDQAFPGSKFVLTVREPGAWLSSVRKHFAKLPSQLDSGPSGRLRELLYGAVRPSDEQFMAAYQRFLQAVGAHFAGRPDDLLVLNIADRQGWGPLCGFLGAEVPSIDFPNTNRADGKDGVGHPEEAKQKLSLGQTKSMFEQLSAQSQGQNGATIRIKRA